MQQTLDISWQTITKIFLAGFILYILFLARDIAVWFFFALIISLLLDPVINFLRKLHIPKVLAVILVYASIFAALGLMIYATAPIFVFEINQLSQNIPEYFEKLHPVLEELGVNVAKNFEDFTSTLVSGLKESASSIIKAAFVFFGGIASTILIFAFAFYISLEEKGPERVLLLLTPKKYEGHVIHIFQKAQYQVAGWFGARVLACIFVGLASFVVFFLLDIKYAFILALISGVLTFIPFIGPLITAALAALFVGVSSSWMVALYIVVALYIIQAVENNVITPLLMKKFLDIPPVLVLISLLIGGTIFGILGMIFVVPVCGIIFQFSREFLERRRSEENDLLAEVEAH
ncbi:MAG: AI-2E family transporter [bacterium]|nr:AI-2E family transporter [bacterium]